MKKIPVLLFILGIAQLGANTAKINDLVERLFQIIEVRHREILSIEESITHNRSNLEKEALVKILKEKVRDFVRKDAQVQSVVKDLKNSPDPDLAYLYSSSTDRLDHYRHNIDQIQELYFRKPVIVADPITTRSGGSDFENFLSSWEQERAPLDKRTVARIPAEQKTYFERVEQDYFRQEEPEFGQFVSDLGEAVENPPQKEGLPAQDLKPLDRYHDTLTKERRTPVRTFQKDGQFSDFYENLEQDKDREKRATQVHSGYMDTDDGSDQAGYEKILRSTEQDFARSEPDSPFERLLQDLSRHGADKETPQAVEKVPDFAPASTLFDGSDENFIHFRSEGDDSGTSENAEEFFSEFKAPTAFSVVRAPARMGFTDFLNGFADSVEGSGESSGKLSDLGPTRFAAILDTLQRENMAPERQRRNYSTPSRPAVTSAEQALEQDLGLVFTARVVDKVSEVRNIDSEIFEVTTFPNQSKGTVPRGRIGLRELADPGAGAFAGISSSSGDSGEEKKIKKASIRSGEGIKKTVDKDKVSEVIAEKKDSFSLLKKDSDSSVGMSLSGREHAIARKAEARVLRHGASLIPISIEARDVKERLYPDLPVSFEVEMRPANFLAGHILNSYTDSPWKKTVTTNSDGIAEIQLLLDLQEHEVNISREVIADKESTTCKIVITPRI
jgi:hypothetical protein